MKPLLFRLKIASLSLLISGLLVVGFGVFFLTVIGRVGMARIDSEIKALGEAQVRTHHPSSHWASFDRSLHFIYGDEPSRRIAARVLNADGEALFTSQHWPEELSEVPAPELPHPPVDDLEGGDDDRRGRPGEPGKEFVSRLDRDGDGRVSAEEFDGPREHFRDSDSDADGYLDVTEAPQSPPSPDRGGGGPGRGPGVHGRHFDGPRDSGRSERQLPLRPRLPVFETHATPTGSWRMGFMGNDEVTLVVAANLSALHGEAALFRNAFLIVTPIALLVLGLAGWMLAARAMRPVAVITRTAEAITARGLDRRIPATSTDAELARLVDVINSMLDRLERGFHQAARFSADAAHELQTPLTVLQGELDCAVQHAAAGSEEQQRYSGLLEEVRGLKTIMQKLLLLARADVGQLPLNVEDVDLSALLQSAVEDVEAMAPGLAIETDIPAGIRTRADAGLLGQVIRNMTSNAIRYNLEGGTIRFKLGLHDGTVKFTLANTGSAIPEADRERVFTRFHRVDKARSRETRGTGLGLSLAREIAHAHGGDLVLDPPRDGMVSFTLTLPPQ